jgi:hypothetical protein
MNEQTFDSSKFENRSKVLDYLFSRHVKDEEAVEGKSVACIVDNQLNGLPYRIKFVTGCDQYDV